MAQIITPADELFRLSLNLNLPPPGSSNTRTTACNPDLMIGYDIDLQYDCEVSVAAFLTANMPAELQKLAATRCRSLPGRVRGAFGGNNNPVNPEPAMLMYESDVASLRSGTITTQVKHYLHWRYPGRGVPVANKYSLRMLHETGSSMRPDWGHASRHNCLLSLCKLHVNPAHLNRIILAAPAVLPFCCHDLAPIVDPSDGFTA
jgi:hypothetical protein